MRIRFALACFIIVGGWLAGRTVAWTGGRRRRMLETLIQSIRKLKLQIIRLAAPLEDALRHSEAALFSMVADNLTEAGSAQDAWNRVARVQTRRGGDADCLQKPELDVLNGLFAHLGETGRYGQEEALDACIASLEEILSEAREQGERRDKLCSSLGLLLGLAAAVLIM